MQSPSVAKTVDITYSGEPRTLKFGLLAFKDLGLNPFDPASIAEFTAQRLDLSVMARLVRAGLLHEYHGKGASRKGQEPPTADDVLVDMENLDEFAATFKSINELLGEDDKNAEATEPADPPAA